MQSAEMVCTPVSRVSIVETFVSGSVRVEVDDNFGK